MRIKLSTKGNCDIVNITAEVENAIKSLKAREGISVLSCPGSTVGITTIEYEPGILKDFKELMDNIIPSNKQYHHDKAWGDANGFSHLRSALVKPFLTIPIENGKLLLGTWQQIVFIDFDNRPREREIVIKVIEQ